MTFNPDRIKALDPVELLQLIEALYWSYRDFGGTNACCRQTLHLIRYVTQISQLYPVMVGQPPALPYGLNNPQCALYRQLKKTISGVNVPYAKYIKMMYNNE